MGRLSDQLIDQIKSEVSLVNLVRTQGYSPKAHGKDYALCCPFHEDDTASLIITPDKNLYHCFGCGAAGSVVDWVMKTQGISFRHAVELLRNEHPSLVADSDDPPKVVKKSFKQTLPTPLAADVDRQESLCQVIDYYHETLKQSPEALEYLKQRGLDNAELIDTFRLGYANRSLAYRLPQKNRKAGAELRGKLQEIGLLRESGHEHFNGSLVVPVIDEQGAITEVYGRKILGKRLRKGTAQHLYLPGPHEGVWNIQAFKASQEIILCEALIDAMTFWVNGFRNVTASYGTQGFTPDLLAALKAHGILKVLIAYDRDDAGNQAAKALAEKLMAEGIDCFRVNLPKGMDVNEYARQMNPAQKALDLVIRKAEWMGNGERPGVERPSVERPGVEQSRDTPPMPAPAPVAGLADPVEITEHEINLTLSGRDAGPRAYRVRGLGKNAAYDQLKINLLVRSGDRFHVDTLDLYAARSRQQFSQLAGRELGLNEADINADLGKLLLQLEAIQAEQLQEKTATDKASPLTEAERKEALALLQDPSLLSRIVSDVEVCGVVGEPTNVLVSYLAAVSRKLEKPLAVMIQSTSAAGKSSLMEAVLQLIPEEERVQFSAMTGQSLFYMNDTCLKHKILAIAEEEGADQASYALKLLQSEGEVSIASTGKNAVSGQLETQSYKVEGPVMLMLTTTAIDIDEELMNRCLVLSVNESREQTEAIHRLQRQRQTLEGLLAEQSKKTLQQLHQNAQRLLRPLLVANPYAEQLTFLSDKTRTRRDHMKYLTLIRAIALLHQYQREVKRTEHQGQSLEYIEVTPADIEMANELAHEVLGRTLDELPPQTRKLLGLIHHMVREQCKKENTNQQDIRFTRKSVRDFTGWSDGQLKIHCTRLEDMEYLLLHSGGRGKPIHYELLYDGTGQPHQRHLMGLLDLNHLYDAQKSGVNAQKTCSSQGQVSPKSGGCQTAEGQSLQGLNGKNNPSAENALLGENGLITSYPQQPTPLAASTQS